MRLPILFFLLLCKIVLMAQSDSTAQVLGFMKHYDQRIETLESSFYSLLLFNWISNAVLAICFLYVLLDDLAVLDKLRQKIKNIKLRWYGARKRP